MKPKFEIGKLVTLNVMQLWKGKDPIDLLLFVTLSVGKNHCIISDTFFREFKVEKKYLTVIK